MDKRANFPLLLVVLVVGLANAYAIFAGLSSIAQKTEAKNFDASSSSTQSVVTLSRDRFATVDAGRISTYDVDSVGRVSLLDEFDASNNRERPRSQYPDPTPTPMPVPRDTSHIIIN